MACVRVNNYFAVSDFFVQVIGILRWHHDVIIAINDQRWLGDES